MRVLQQKETQLPRLKISSLENSRGRSWLSCNSVMKQHCTLVTLHIAHCSIAPWSHQLCLQLQHRLPSAASPWEAMAALMAPMMASRIGSLWLPSLPPSLPPTERMLRSCIGDYPAPRKLPRPYLLERENWRFMVAITATAPDGEFAETVFKIETFSMEPCCLWLPSMSPPHLRSFR